MLGYNGGFWETWLKTAALKVIFDGDTRRIHLKEGVKALNAQADLYSAWKRWSMYTDTMNMKFPQAFRSFGGDTTSPGNNAPAYYFLTNGWRIVVDGRRTPDLEVGVNLYTDEGESPFLVTNEATVMNSRSDGVRAEDIWKYMFDHGIMANANIQQVRDMVINTIDDFKDGTGVELTELSNKVDNVQTTVDNLPEPIKMTEAELHSGLDSYESKDEWKATDKADVQPVLDAIGELHNFDPANDTVARVTLVDKTTENTDMITPEEMTEAELHSALDSYENKGDWKDSATVDETTLHSALDTYGNKDDYKADVSNLSADVNVVAVNGVTVDSIEDFKASEVDLTPVTDRLGELHNFDPVNDTVTVQTTLDKLTTEELHTTLDSYSNKGDWKATDVDLSPVLDKLTVLDDKVSSNTESLLAGITDSKTVVLDALVAAEDRLAITLSIIANLASDTRNKVTTGNVGELHDLIVGIQDDLGAIRVKAASKEEIAAEIWDTEL